MIEHCGSAGEEVWSGRRPTLVVVMRRHRAPVISKLFAAAIQWLVKAFRAGPPAGSSAEIRHDRGHGVASTEAMHGGTSRWKGTARSPAIGRRSSPGSTPSAGAPVPASLRGLRAGRSWPAPTSPGCTPPAARTTRLLAAGCWSLLQFPGRQERHMASRFKPDGRFSVQVAVRFHELATGRYRSRGRAELSVLTAHDRVPGAST